MIGGILSGLEIENAIDTGVIEIDPYEPKNINPASIDLRLGNEVKVYEDWVQAEDAGGDGHLFRAKTFSVRDVKHKPSTLSFEADPDKGWVLKPGILYLMHTFERIRLGRMVSVLDGKSSLGRLGIQVHVTAGYFDPGWDGQGTLEVVVTHPIRVYPGMKFCQMRFHSLVGEMLNYQETGHYTGKAAFGAEASAAHTQFQE